MKEARLKKLLILYDSMYDFLEKAKLKEQKSDQGLPWWRSG